MMGEFDKAMETNYMLDIYQKLSDGSFYDNILCNFRIRLYDHLGNNDQFHKNFNILLQSPVKGCDFLDFFKNDINTCEYLIEKNYKEESKRLLDNLEQQTEKLSLAYLDYHLQKVQLSYSEKFCGNKRQTKVYQVYLDLKARFNDYAKSLPKEIFTQNRVKFLSVE
jgi:hypothetical protein